MLEIELRSKPGNNYPVGHLGIHKEERAIPTWPAIQRSCSKLCSDLTRICRALTSRSDGSVSFDERLTAAGENAKLYL